MFDTRLAQHLAQLSKIRFTDAELEKITKDMGNIITLMDTVLEFEGGDTALREAKGIDSLRTDRVEPSTPRDEIMKNAAQKSGNGFSVPKVV